MNNTKKLNGKLSRINEEFDKELEEIARERYSKRIDNKLIGREELTKKMLFTKDFSKIKDELIGNRNPSKNGDDNIQIKNRKILFNNRGSIVTDLLIWMIFSFFMVVSLALLIWGFGQVTQSLEDIPDNTPGVNISYAVDITIVQVNNALPVWRWIAVAIIVTMALSIFISNYLIKIHPVFFVAYLLITIGCIIISTYISNVYQGLLTNGDVVSTALAPFSASNYIFIYLPIWVTIIGLIGAIFLFMGMIRDSGAGGGINP